MFSKDKSSNSKSMSPTVLQNVISHNTKIVGDIKSEGAFRIDGYFEGHLITKEKVVIGKNGQVKGTVEGTNVDIEGTFSGKLSLTGTLSLKASAQIEGEVITQKLAVEPGATFNATCSMKSSVKSLDANKSVGKSTKKDAERTA